MSAAAKALARYFPGERPLQPGDRMECTPPPDPMQKVEALAKIADGLAHQLATERAANDQLRAMLARVDPEPAIVRFARTRRWQLLFVLTTCLTALAAASVMVTLHAAPLAAPPPATWTTVAPPWSTPAAYAPGRKDTAIPVALPPRAPVPRRSPRSEGLAVPSAWVFGDLAEQARDAAIERAAAGCEVDEPSMASVIPDPELGLQQATVRVHRPTSAALQSCVERAVRRAASTGRIPRLGVQGSRRFLLVLGTSLRPWTGLAACDDFAARACAGGDQDRCDDAAHLITAWKDLGIAADRCAPARGRGRN